MEENRHKPWITKEIKKGLSERDKQFKNFIKEKNQGLKYDLFLNNIEDFSKIQKIPIDWSIPLEPGVTIEKIVNFNQSIQVI